MRTKVIIYFSLFVSITYGASFDRINIGSRAIGMAGSFTAIADNTSGIYYNPAGLPAIKSDEIEFMYENLNGLDFVNYYFFGYTRPNIWKGTIGFGYIYLGLGDEILLRNFSEHTFFFSYGIRIKRHFFTGLNLKFYGASYDWIRGTAWAPDIGFLFNLKEKLYLGAIIQDIISPKIKWETGAEDKIDINLNLGAALKITERFTISSDLKNVFNYERTVSSGFELEFYKELIFLRGGFSYQKIFLISFGAGLNLSNFQINLTVQKHSDFGFNSIIGANIKL